MTPTKKPDDQLLDRAAVAARIGVTAESVSRYVARGDMPGPDLHFGRAPVWQADTIDAWLAQRPGRGAGGGRPPAKKATKGKR